MSNNSTDDMVGKRFNLSRDAVETLDAIAVNTGLATDVIVSHAIVAFAQSGFQEFEKLIDEDANRRKALLQQRLAKK